ncbi:MAG TPA: lipopolysaccharide heptosyltransferase II [Bacteroidota bacterium]|nr:lipopolysaccharide heptosyltransferase II [Bacteroidota bacterium]
MGEAGELKNILVIQTAFLGDVVLTLPLVQQFKQSFPSAGIDVVVVPRAAELLTTHPDIRSVIVYDKRGKDKGLSGLFRLAKSLRPVNYDVAFIPHRSLRSAALARLAAIPQRIGFNRSAGSFLFTKTVRYDDSLHEVDRNLSLLKALDVQPQLKTLPRLYPSDQDRSSVDQMIASRGITPDDTIVAIAPGSVWNTKRWLKEGFTGLAQRLSSDNSYVAVIGGEQDRALCDEICSGGNARMFSVAGKLSLLQSAELIRRSALIVSNDSAPVHLAMAVDTPVIAIFGPTVPEFGFAPYGASDVVVQTTGLSCKPCSIHGGDTCPVGTFECMKSISADAVYRNVQSVLSRLKEQKNAAAKTV